MVEKILEEVKGAEAECSKYILHPFSLVNRCN